ncbi:MAG: hypothetical protein ACR2JP_06630 [Acidimicrobiia bacterium]
MAVLAVLAALVVTVPASAQQAEREAEVHCVAVATGETADGQLVVTEPECFASPADAAAATEEAIADLAASTTPGIGVNTALPGAIVPLAASLTLGIHYDGSSGTGSSIAIVGSGCTGGYWNASATWKNRISSTYNGCGRLKHYDYQNRLGMTYTTYGVGDLDSLSWFSDMTESVSYHAS